MNKSLLLIALTFLVFNISCKKSPTSSSTNTAPVASFSITPTSGTVDTVFDFDATVSSDIEDATSVLEVRWDWNNDGTWDVNYNVTKTATYKFASEGNYTVKLEVKDSEGLTNTTTKTITVLIANVTDIDGNVYNTIQIGNQVWMAENLKVMHYRNGEVIQNVTDNTQWSNLSTGAYCSYENSVSNISIYGLLYNWSAVDDSRGLAPAGWHIPSDEEWKHLEMYLGMSQTEADDTGSRGTDEGSKLKSTSGWYNNGNGTNESGFTALPGGYRGNYNGNFYNMGDYTFFWSSTETNSINAGARELDYDESGVYRYYDFDKGYGFSVRCVRD